MQRNIRAIILAGILLGFLTGCGDSDAPQARGQRPAPDPPSVEVIQARLGTLPLELRLNGVVQARNQITIYPEVTGRIAEVLVDNGDSVEQGQVLVRLQARQAEEQLNQARANLRVQEANAAQSRARLQELEIELERIEELATRDFVSELEISRFRAQVDAARADYERALAVVESAESTVAEREWALSQTVIRAPVKGLVGRRNAEIGMRADGSTPLFVIGDMDQVHVRVRLTEQMLQQVDVGQRALIRFGGSEERVLEAEVSRISPFLDAGTFSTEATIHVANPDRLLRSGMFVNVEILYGETDTATLIPISAIYRDARTDRAAVFLAPELDPEPDGHMLDGMTMGRPIGDPTPIRFQEVEVVAFGRSAAGVRGLEPGSWVVAVGHDLVDRSRDVDDHQARTRPISWERLLQLQELQQHDVLQQFMERQQRRTAGTIGRQDSSTN